FLHGRDRREPGREAVGLHELEEAGPRGGLHARRNVREALGGAAVRVLIRGCRCGQDRGRDLIDVALSDVGVAVAGEDDLTLLSELEAPIDRVRRLSEDGAVRGSAATAERTAATVEERQLDLLLLRPLSDLRLSLVERERRRDRAHILRRVGVAEHDLELAPGLFEARRE